MQNDPQAPSITEDQAVPANPELSYGWAKLLGEKQIQYTLAQRSKLKAGIAENRGCLGPRQDFDLATGSPIPVLIRRALEYPNRKPFRVLGTGAETRSYCFISDIVDALILMVEEMDRRNPVGPINIGREDSMVFVILPKK